MVSTRVIAPTKPKDEDIIRVHFPRDSKICLLYKKDADEETNTVALMANLEGMAQTTDMKQLCAYVMGMFINFNPAWETNLLDMTMHKGYALQVVEVPAQALQNGLNVDTLPDFDAPTSLVIFAMAMLYMFKQVSTINFTQYTESRVAALRAIVGMDPEIAFPNPFTLPKASALRTMLGAIPSLKSSILRFVMNVQYGRDIENSMARYICGILEWNEMNAFTFVNESLVLTQSPILRDYRLASEMMNFYEAAKAVSNCPTPQYFKYLSDSTETCKIERAKFPMLMAIAVKIKQESMGADSLKNFENSKLKDDPTVADLFHAHMMITRNVQPLTLENMIDELFAVPEVSGDNTYIVEEVVDTMNEG